MYKLHFYFNPVFGLLFEILSTCNVITAVEISTFKISKINKCLVMLWNWVHIFLQYMFLP